MDLVAMDDHNIHVLMVPRQVVYRLSSTTLRLQTSGGSTLGLGELIPLSFGFKLPQFQASKPQNMGIEAFLACLTDSFNVF